MIDRLRRVHEEKFASTIFHARVLTRRFVGEWLRSANTIIERLRLKSTALRTQIKKAEQQLIQRKELGESLHAVDFEQLNIENKDYVKMIEEKNRYVIEMKRIAGDQSSTL